MTLFPDHNKYYRIPWSLPDNAISWLEITKACNAFPIDYDYPARGCALRWDGEHV
jgi:hypothetical protein